MFYNLSTVKIEFQFPFFIKVLWNLSDFSAKNDMNHWQKENPGEMLNFR